uniref:Uncharacterized protein n=1 Tax=Manihot esculenta TaxID=3983 RepID=A0A2C9W5F6_MANES
MRGTGPYLAYHAWPRHWPVLSRMRQEHVGNLIQFPRLASPQYSIWKCTYILV